MNKCENMKRQSLYQPAWFAYTKVLICINKQTIQKYKNSLSKFRDVVNFIKINLRINSLTLKAKNNFGSHRSLMLP